MWKESLLSSAHASPSYSKLRSPVARYMNEEATLEVGLPAPAMPADTAYTRNKPLSQALPRSVIHRTVRKMLVLCP